MKIMIKKLYPLILLIIISFGSNVFAQNFPERVLEPLVLQGGALTQMIGQEPAKIVGFKSVAGRWIQIPI